MASETNRAVDRTGHYDLYTPLLPHVRAVAEHAEAAGAPVGATHASPLQQTAGRLWNELGYHLHHLADYEGAKACCERALGILEQHLPPEHPHIRIVRGNLEGLG